jgi:uncharacterized cupredoxin-like copper-binding protein
MKLIFSLMFVLTIFFTQLEMSFAAGDMTKQEPVEIYVNLGNEKGEIKFFPNKLLLETGKLYKLIIKNNSPQKHYFSSDKFSQAVFTRKVQISTSSGKPIAEIKGLVREIEVYPGRTAEWWFVPLKTGKFDDLRCTIPGHAEAGMVGVIEIK